MTGNYELWQSSLLTGTSSRSSVLVGLWSIFGKKTWILELHLVFPFPSKLGTSSRIPANFHDRNLDFASTVWPHGPCFLLVLLPSLRLSQGWIPFQMGLWLTNLKVISWDLNRWNIVMKSGCSLTRLKSDGH
jgi:hypothetical protein